MHIFNVLIVTLEQRHHLILKSQKFFKPIQTRSLSPQREHMHQDLWLIRENNKRSMKYLFFISYFNTLGITVQILGYKRLLASREDPHWPHIPVTLWDLPMGDCQDKKNFSHGVNQSSKLP